MDEKTKSEGNEDLYAELRKTLESAEEESVAADDQEPKQEDEPVKEEIIDESGELSEDEISKLHPKAQKRIKELAEQVKALADKPAEKSPEEEPKEDEPAQDYKNVQEFLEAVQDEPSRKLLEKFYGVIKSETSSILAPLEQKNNETKFETEFSQYERIEGIKDYKNDLKKTFLRNPNQSLKALVGEVVTDLQINKVKPIEKSPSSPNRNGKVDLDNLTKEQLFERLDSLRE
jgi:hypothetical protein